MSTDVGPLPAGGAFVMASCGESGSSAGWALINTTNSPDVDGDLDCPPTNGNNPAFPDDPNQTGIWVSDHLLAGSESHVGDRAEAVFATQAGTRIIRARYWRRLARLSDRNWQVYLAFGNRENIVETCELNGATTCTVGSGDWYANDPNPDLDRSSYVDRPDLDTDSMIVGVYCRPNVNDICLNGSTLNRAQAQVFSAYFTIADPIAPTVGVPMGDGWSAEGWVEGELGLGLASSDVTGISATNVYADGSLIATVERTCTYDRPRPCTDEPDGEVGLPTSGLADGLHAIEVGAVDAAGNETRVARTEPLEVDGRAPEAPVGLGAVVPVSASDSFAATWSLPEDHGSPIVAARYEVCQAGRCGPVLTAPSLTGVGGLALPEPGTGTLRVWLVDAMDHEDPATAATVTLTYAPVAPPPGRPDPGPLDPGPLDPGPLVIPSPPDETLQDPANREPGPVVKRSAALKLKSVRRAGRRVTVAGTISRKASGRVTVSYRARVGRRSRTAGRRAAIKKGTFRTTLTLAKTLARNRSGTVVVTYRGDADTKAATVRSTVRLAAR